MTCIEPYSIVKFTVTVITTGTGNTIQERGRVLPLLDRLDGGLAAHATIDSHRRGHETVVVRSIPSGFQVANPIAGVFTVSLRSSTMQHESDWSTREAYACNSG